MQASSSGPPKGTASSSGPSEADLRTKSIFTILAEMMHKEAAQAKKQDALKADVQKVRLSSSICQCRSIALSMVMSESISRSVQIAIFSATCCSKHALVSGMLYTTSACCRPLHAVSGAPEHSIIDFFFFFASSLDCTRATLSVVLQVCFWGR